MPTRLEKLQKRKDRVKEKADDKINRQGYGGRTVKVKGKKVARIDKKIVKTKARVTKRESKPKRRVVTKGKTNSGAKVKTVVVKKKDGTVKRSRSVVSGKGIKRNVVDSRRPNKGNAKMRRQVRKVYKKTGTLPSL